MNTEQFPFAASRVLNRINQMFAIYFFKKHLQKRFPQESKTEYAMIALENACLDSSLFALRAFDDFGRSQRNKPDDLISEDFPELRLVHEGMCPDERLKINKYLAHLTHLDLAGEVQLYSYRHSLSKVLPMALAFCDYLINSELSGMKIRSFANSTKEVCECIQDSYINHSDDQKMKTSSQS